MCSLIGQPCISQIALETLYRDREFPRPTVDKGNYRVASKLGLLVVVVLDDTLKAGICRMI